MGVITSPALVQVGYILLGGCHIIRARPRRRRVGGTPMHPHALSSVGTNPGRARACRHHDFSKILEGRCGIEWSSLEHFGGIRAENGTSSDGSERFYMSYGPCSVGVPSAAPSPVLIALASRKSSLPRMHIWHVWHACGPRNKNFGRIIA